MTVALLAGTMLHQFGGWTLTYLLPGWPTPQEWLLLALLGTIGCLGHLMVVHAFRYVDASTLAPLQYFEIVGAALFGWLVFSDVPTINTWVGIAIITGSGFYVYWRERTLNNASRS
jgi:drug/metabolite transporter (DMT)-like permease